METYLAEITQGSLSAYLQYFVIFAIAFITIYAIINKGYNLLGKGVKFLFEKIMVNSNDEEQ